MTAPAKKQGKIHYAWIIMIACCFLQAGQLGTIQAWAPAFMMPIVGRWLPTKNINVLMTVAAILDGGGFMLMSQFTEPWQWWLDAVVIGIGTFLTTVIDFILVAFVVFLVVKAFNAAKQKLEKPAEPEPEPEEPEPTKEELLLTEIRDLLKTKG